MLQRLLCFVGRDGEQSPGASMNIEEKMHLAEVLESPAQAVEHEPHPDSVEETDES